MNILSTHEQFKSRELSPLELTKSLLEKAKKNEHNAYITITEDLALAQAKRAEESIKKGNAHYLTGIPFSLKDLFITKGIRTTGGSKILYNYIPPYEGHVAEKLQGHGGVLLGKVGCDEFGMGSTNEYTAFGSVANPFNKDCVAGGSSGGSAASVAEKSAFYSIGTDTGGSVRLPANFCHLYGLKPTYGRVSRYGQIAYGSSLDQASPMANSTMDLACIMEALSIHDERDATNAPKSELKNLVNDLAQIDASYLKGKKVVYSPELIDGCEEDIKKNLLAQLEELKQAGCELVEANLPHLKYSVSTYYIIATSEASANLARYDGVHYGYSYKEAKNLVESYTQTRTHGFGDEVKRRILLGTFSLSSGYQDEYFAKACKMRRLIHQDFQNVLSQGDVFFSPVCASTAFSMGIQEEDSFKMYMNDLYTLPVNLAGVPALAIPSGKVNNMPTGFQLVMNSFEDKELLKFGHAIDCLTGKKS